MKFSSTFLPLAEVLHRAFRQTDDEEVSRRDTGYLINILGPLDRLTYDQFSRVAIPSVQERREIVMDLIVWPSPDMKRRFLKLPSDIFGGKFEEHLQTEVKPCPDSGDHLHRRLPGRLGSGVGDEDNLGSNDTGGIPPTRQPPGT